MTTLRSRRLRIGASAPAAGSLILAILVLFFTSGTASAQPTRYLTKLTQAQAAAQLRAAGVSWTSSGHCTTRSNPRCTSLAQINRSTVRGVITLKRASGCAIIITGGTEVGHGTRTHSRYTHYNGYKLDLAHNRCLDRYLHRAFRYAGIRGDGYPQWRAPSGNIYCNEGSHWDVTYFTCGC